jgi:hypothetical protein
MAYNTIAIVETGMIRKEAKADAAITPGMLLERTTTGVKKHAGAGLVAQRMFALEDLSVAPSSTATIDTDYDASDIVQIGIFPPGTEVYAWLNNGENAAIGKFLESAGNGKLRVLASDTSAGTIEVGSIVGVALEAVDMSGSSGVDPSGRIRIEVW